MKFFVTRATDESPRMFENDLVDAFSRTHPMVVAVLFIPATLALMAWSVLSADVSIPSTLGLFAAGFVVWTLTEYWLHRTLFHWTPRGRWGERMHFLVHGVHHSWPKDRYRLVMPPAVSLTLFCIFMGLWYLAVGGTYCWATHAGFTFGYMVYDLTHYYIHHFHPKTKWGLELKKNHMLHHFKDPTRRFGVSTMFWDRVFGTSPEKRPDESTATADA